MGVERAHGRLNRPRRFAGRLANLQQPWLVIARAPRTAIRVGQRLDVSVRLAGAAEPPDDARLVWRFGGQGGDAAIGSEPMTIVLTGGAVGAIAVAPLELEARDREGRLLSRNALEFCVVPPIQGPALSLFPLDGAAWSALAAIGWPNRAATLEQADIVAATRLTTPVWEALIAGRKVLLIANTADALIDLQRKLPLHDRHNFPSMLLRSREGTPKTGSGWACSAGGAWTVHGPAAERADARRALGRGSCRTTC